MQEVGSFFDSLNLFLKNNMLVVVFLIAALYILKKSNPKQCKYLIMVAVMAVLFVFNGITFAVIKWIGEDTTYYRFFWICPIVLASAYLMVELLFEVAVTKWQKVSLVLIFAIMVFGNYGQAFSSWGNIPSNVYQIDNDIVQIGDLIDAHNDGERTILLANDYVSSHIREYNSNIMINSNGNIYLDAIVNGDNINYSGRNLMMFMEMNIAGYIAVEKEKIGTNRLFISIGCEKIGESENFNLYYYDEDILYNEVELFESAITEKRIYINSEYISIPGLEEQKDYLYITDLWLNTSESQKQAIIDLANELRVEAVIINSVAENKDITSEFLEEELAQLEVPYIYNSDVIHELEEERFSIVCVPTEDASLEKLQKRLSLEKAVVLITDTSIFRDDASTTFKELITTEDSPVVEVISDNNVLYKEMLNDNIMLYSAMDVNADAECGFVTLLRLKGLEAE